MPKISLHFIFSSKKNLLLSFLLSFIFTYQFLSAQLTLTSSAVSETFCTGEEIMFLASGSTSYEFLVNGVVVQPRSSSNTYSSVLTQSSSVTVLGDTLSQTITLPLYFNSVEAATISGTQQICYGESISLNVVSHGSVQGNL